SVLRGIAASGDLTEEAMGPRLIGACTALAGKGQGSPGDCESVVEPVGEDVRVAQIPEEKQLLLTVSRGLHGAQRLLQQRDTLSNPPRERVGVAQASCVGRRKDQVPLPTQRQPAFEQRDGVTKVSPDDLEIGESPARPAQAIGVIERLSEA